MEYASGGNLEEYLHVQWDPALDPEYQKQKARQRRRTPSLVSDPFETEAKDHATIYGGIGIGPKGRKIRYLTEQEIWRFFLDICAGLVHLHSHGIIHRDLVRPPLC